MATDRWGRFGDGSSRSVTSDWFDGLWANAATYDLAGLFENRFEPHPPYLIYLRMLWELYGADLDTEDATQTDTSGKLTVFQAHGVDRAKRILKRYGGVLVADEVGLKLMSGRDKDINDLVQLAEHVGATSSTALLAIYDHVYAASPTYNTQRGFVESVCADIARLVQSHLSGNDIPSDIEHLATVYGGEDLQDDDMSHRDSQSDKNSSSTSGQRCRRRTKLKRRCRHPKPPPGGCCAAGHRH